MEGFPKENPVKINDEILGGINEGILGGISKGSPKNPLKEL